MCLKSLDFGDTWKMQDFRWHDYFEPLYEHGLGDNSWMAKKLVTTHKHCQLCIPKGIIMVLVNYIDKWVISLSYTIYVLALEFVTMMFRAIFMERMVGFLDIIYWWEFIVSWYHIKYKVASKMKGMMHFKYYKLSIYRLGTTSTTNRKLRKGKTFL